MKNEIIHLFADKPDVTLTTYLFEHKNKKAPAMLILPGGGYGGICADREGEPIAVSFSALGFRCFVFCDRAQASLYPSGFLLRKNPPPLSRGGHVFYEPGCFPALMEIGFIILR